MFPQSNVCNTTAQGVKSALDEAGNINKFFSSTERLIIALATPKTKEQMQRRKAIK